MAETQGSTLTSSVLAGAAELADADWQRLDTENDPFINRVFLTEAERCAVGQAAIAWQPMHIVLRRRDGGLAGMMPLYLRYHWYGDFAVDYGWDRAWTQHSLSYFPKLVTGVPFTPSPGPRLLLAADSGPLVRSALVEAAKAATAQIGASNWQCLFVQDEDKAALAEAGLLLRRGVQFHWLQHGYRDFQDFLTTLTAEKRKKMKRERRAVVEAGLRIEVRHGDEIDEALWMAIHRHYRSTFERLGGFASFSPDFFRRVGAALGRRMVVFCAFNEGEQPVASAICYRNDNALYGRHWGTDIDCPGLHFELCYHAGIEYAIDQGLTRFEPGAQGEHKVARGFEPVSTWSAFWIADPQLREAVARYVVREDEAVADYQTEMARHLPFRSA